MRGVAALVIALAPAGALAGTGIGTPIVGDGKYGGVNAHPGGEIPRKLHLHARSIDIAHPDGGRLFIEAELPPHMKTSWKLLGFDERDAEDAFAGLEG